MEMDLYQLFQASGKEATVIRVIESVDYSTGLKHDNKLFAYLPVAIIPATWNLRYSRTEFIEAALIVLLDAYYKEEIPLWPIQFDDYVIVDRIAYRVTFTTEHEVNHLLVALRAVKGTPPFNITSVAA